MQTACNYILLFSLFYQYFLLFIFSFCMCLLLFFVFSLFFVFIFIFILFLYLILLSFFFLFFFIFLLVCLVVFFFFFSDLVSFRSPCQALMTMFQILIQEGWIEVVDEIMGKVQSQHVIIVLVASYFVLFHLFVSLVSRSQLFGSPCFGFCSPTQFFPLIISLLSKMQPILLTK